MEHTIISTKLGQVRGVHENNVRGHEFFAFRGIPYAKPPIGNLRFKDPEPIEPWSGVKNTFQYGNKCAQMDWIQRKFCGNEDCLYLNVYTTDLKPAAPRAVMVWIHGGLFSFGDYSDDVYGPDYLVETDIVLVTINYRLGALGFLNVDNEIASGNQGLKDQVLALKWVQEHISCFGGDSNNVTIFGESAGGASVHYLTISPLAQGLFHKAIMQSGVATNTWASGVYSTKETAIKLASALGKEITDPDKLVEFLRTVDACQLVEAEYSLRTWHVDKLLSIYPFGPSIDVKSKKSFLSIPVQQATQMGVRVPCMFGYVSHEGLFMIADTPADKYARINEDPEHLLIHPTMKKFLKDNNITVQDMKKIYMGNEKLTTEIREKFADLAGAVHFYIGIHEMIAAQTKTSNIPTYVYKFDYDDDNPMMQKIMNINIKGTCHSEELNYLFCPKLLKVIGKEIPALGSTEHRISQRFVELWTNFAKTGNPTPQITELIPTNWESLGHNPVEYDCLEISEDLKMIKETNIMHQIREKIGRNI